MKIKHLPSVRENQPHKYVFWQLLSLIIVKIINFSVIFFLIGEDIEWFIFPQKLMDAYSSPLIMVLSYLGCNKRTFVEFLKLLKPKNVFKSLVCPFRTSTIVEAYSPAQIAVSTIS
ncbi:unnamed protein product [Caenorhabditis brenneri]